MVNVKEFGDTAIVGSTDVRRQWGTICDDVLPHYGTVLVEKNGKIVAQLSSPPEDAGATTRTFGEEDTGE